MTLVFENLLVYWPSRCTRPRKQACWTSSCSGLESLVILLQDDCHTSHDTNVTIFTHLTTKAMIRTCH